MTERRAAQALPAFLRSLERAALVDAARTVGDLAASGTPVAEIVGDLLAPAQVEVGQRWARAQWTVAQEHAATAIIPSVVVDHASWLAEVLSARSVPRDVVADLHACLADDLQDEVPAVAALLRRAAAAVGGSRRGDALPRLVAP